MTTRYTSTIDSDGNGSITILDTDTSRVEVFTSDDPNFNHVFVAMEQGLPLDEAIQFRIPVTIESYSDRVKVQGRRALQFDGEPVNDSINETAMRWAAEGRDLMPLVLFLKNLEDNVSRQSRESLFNWLTEQRLEIDREGMVIGYRGLRSDMHSYHSGGAYVLTKEQRAIGMPEPGVWIDGHIPNEVGSIISMDRRDVDDNSTVGCSYGLHVGSFSYASSWADGETTVAIRINPRDVVSVPTGEFSKMRVCRYEVLSHINEGVDHEPVAVPENAIGPNVEATEKALDQLVPTEFRKKMAQTMTEFINRMRG
jgi:hypothetical protein